jgi:hypothetical protein
VNGKPQRKLRLSSEAEGYFLGGRVIDGDFLPDYNEKEHQKPSK